MKKVRRLVVRPTYGTYFFFPGHFFATIGIHLVTEDFKKLGDDVGGGSVRLGGRLGLDEPRCVGGEWRRGGVRSGVRWQGASLVSTNGGLEGHGEGDGCGAGGKKGREAWGTYMDTIGIS